LWDENETVTWVFCKRCRRLKMEYSWVKEVEWKRRKMRRNAQSGKSGPVLRSSEEEDSSEEGDNSSAEMEEGENSSDVQMGEDHEEEGEKLEDELCLDCADRDCLRGCDKAELLEMWTETVKTMGIAKLDRRSLDVFFF